MESPTDMTWQHEVLGSRLDCAMPKMTRDGDVSHQQRTGYLKDKIPLFISLKHKVLASRSTCFWK